MTPKIKSLDQQIKAAAKVLNPRQLAFADGYLNGRPAYLAYREGYEGLHERSGAWEIRTNPNVASYMGLCRERLRESAGVTKAEIIDYLLEAIATPVEEVDAGHRLAQEVEIGKNGTKVKSVPKLGAIQELAKLLGWYAPEEKNIKVTRERQELDLAEVNRFLAAKKEAGLPALRRGVRQNVSMGEN